MTKSAVFWSSLVINILSTVLLAASNTCAQLITSPTRAALDQAHKTRKWLDIGVPSVRNLAGLENWKVLCWSLLYLSAGPIHLLIKPSFSPYRLDQDSSASDVPGALHVPHVSPRAAYARNAKHGVENAENHIHGRQAFRGIARRAFLYIAHFRRGLATGQS